MNIEKINIPDSSYYFPASKTGNFSTETMSDTATETEPDTPSIPLSPAEKYQELSGNREQKLQELGLSYTNAAQCTWEEFRSLCSQVLERTEYDACPLENLNILIEDETVEMNCLDYLRRWSEQEAERGNMVGYHMGKQLSGAITNYLMDIQGKSEYLEINGEQVKISIMEDGTFLKCPHLGSAYARGDNGELVSFDARYADDSTAEDPIIEIRTYGEDGTPLEQVYRVVLSQVDPRNATQLEIFALCVHRDKQGYGNPQSRYGDSSYMFGKNLGLFPETSTKDFTEEKRDWIQAFADKIEEIRTMLESAALEQLKQKYTIGNFSLTAKEWEKLLDMLEESRSQFLSAETEEETMENTPEEDPVAEE